MALSKSDIARGFRFIDAPPERAMRRRTPESAPRLFEWLTENGYVEPIKTVRSGAKNSGPPSALDSGRLGGGKKEEKEITVLITPR
jgi:hypothetical protein